MKAMLEAFLSNPAMVLTIVGVLGTVVARILQLIFSHYADRKEVAEAKKVIPVATEVFWLIEKQYEGSAAPNKSVMKALEYAKTFLEHFSAAYGQPSDTAVTVSQQVKADLLNVLNGGSKN